MLQAVPGPVLAGWQRKSFNSHFSTRLIRSLIPIVFFDEEGLIPGGEEPKSFEQLVRELQGAISQQLPLSPEEQDSITIELVPVLKRIKDGAPVFITTISLQDHPQLHSIANLATYLIAAYRPGARQDTTPVNQLLALLNPENRAIETSDTLPAPPVEDVSFRAVTADDLRSYRFATEQQLLAWKSVLLHLGRASARAHRKSPDQLVAWRRHTLQIIDDAAETLYDPGGKTRSPFIGTLRRFGDEFGNKTRRPPDDLPAMTREFVNAHRRLLHQDKETAVQFFDTDARKIWISTLWSMADRHSPRHLAPHLRALHDAGVRVTRHRRLFEAHRNQERAQREHWYLIDEPLVILRETKPLKNKEVKAAQDMAELLKDHGITGIILAGHRIRFDYQSRKEKYRLSYRGPLFRTEAKILKDILAEFFVSYPQNESQVPKSITIQGVNHMETTYTHRHQPMDLPHRAVTMAKSPDHWVIFLDVHTLDSIKEFKRFERAQMQPRNDRFANKFDFVLRDLEPIHHELGHVLGPEESRREEFSTIVHSWIDLLQSVVQRAGFAGTFPISYAWSLLHALNSEGRRTELSALTLALEDAAEKASLTEISIPLLRNLVENFLQQASRARSQMERDLAEIIHTETGMSREQALATAEAILRKPPVHFMHETPHFTEPARLATKLANISKQWHRFRTGLLHQAAAWGKPLTLLATLALLRLFIPYTPDIPIHHLTEETLRRMLSPQVLGVLMGVFVTLSISHRWAGVPSPDSEEQRFFQKSVVMGATLRDFMLILIATPFFIAGHLSGYPPHEPFLSFLPVGLALFKGWPTLFAIGIVHLVIGGWLFDFISITVYGPALIFYRLGAYHAFKLRRPLYDMLDFFLRPPTPSTSSSPAYERPKPEESAHHFALQLLQYAASPAEVVREEGPTRPLLRTAVIGDPHLSARDADPDWYLHFLNTFRFEKIIINGDLIEGWTLQHHWRFPEKHAAVLRKLIDLAKGGTEVVIKDGNHDDFMRENPWFPYFIKQLDQAIQEASRGADRRPGRIIFERGFSIHMTRDAQGRGLAIRVGHYDFLDDAMRFYRWGQVGARVKDMALDLYTRIYEPLSRRWSIFPRYSLSDAIQRRIEGIALENTFIDSVVGDARQTGFPAVIASHTHRGALTRQGSTYYLNPGTRSAIVEWPDHRWQLYRSAEDLAPQDALWLTDDVALSTEILAFDKDNTLLAEDGSLDPGTAELLEEWASRTSLTSSALALVTGDSQEKAAQQLWDVLGRRVRDRLFWLTESGGQMMDSEGHPLVQHAFDKNALLVLTRAVQRGIRTALDDFRHDRTMESPIAQWEDLEIIHRHTALFVTAKSPALRAEIRQSAERPWAKLAEHLEREIRMETKLSDFKVIYSRSGVDIIIRDKETALLELAKRRAAERQKPLELILGNTIVIGDAENDIGMLNLIARHGGRAYWVGIDRPALLDTRVDDSFGDGPAAFRAILKGLLDTHASRAIEPFDHRLRGAA